MREFQKSACVSKVKVWKVTVGFKRNGCAIIFESVDAQPVLWTRGYLFNIYAK